MELPKIDIITADDWIAVYLDGSRSYEGHSIDPKTLLHILDIKYTARDFDHLTDDQLSFEFETPEKLEDFEF